MSALYKIDKHPITREFIVLEFEIVNFTPNFLDIQSRNAINPKAERNTFRIKRISNEYFPSRDEAIKNFMAQQKISIKKAESKIKIAQKNIQGIKEIK